MATKKTKKAAENSGRTASGKFAKGNPHAWRAGESGNPAGRPRDSVTPHLRELARRKRPGADERTQGELVAQMLYDEAIDSKNVQAAKEIIDRLEGKPKQSLDITQADEQKRREWAEAQLERVMETLKVERKEALQWMRDNTPAAAQWIN